MPGWNLKKGILVTEQVSDDEYWSLFNYVFSEACRKRNTYKFGLIKSICDQIYSLSSDEMGYYLSYDKIFSKFAENYWNLVVKYGLRQMRPDGQSVYSKVELILKDAVKEQAIPELIEYTSLSQQAQHAINANVSKECRKYVVGALYSDFQGKLYGFDLKGTGIWLSPCAYRFISKYKMEIEKINYYEWARFLESVNDDDALVRVLEKLELATPQRKDLSMYRDILYREFQENRCFYCGNSLRNTIHVDHFIPWTFVKNDNLWNFVLACPRCNIRKNNRLAGLEYLMKIEERNREIVREMDAEVVRSEFVVEEFANYSEGLLGRMWRYAKMSGVREKG